MKKHTELPPAASVKGRRPATSGGSPNSEEKQRVVGEKRKSGRFARRIDDSPWSSGDYVFLNCSLNAH